MDSLYRNIIHRSEMVLGTPVMEMLSRVPVIVFGVGGVGSWCAEGLVRTGVKRLTIVDSDIICPTNINRQIQATSLNIGRSKVEELAARLRAINPGADITAIHTAFDEKSAGDFKLGQYRYAIDAIDSLKNKILLLEECAAAGVTVFSSMGAAARIDPAKIKVGLISGTSGCPLARNVRRLLREKNIADRILCVYSDESPASPAIETRCGSGECACIDDRNGFYDDNGSGATDWCGMKKQVNGSLVHITAIFGFMLAGLVIEDVMKNSEV